MSTRVAMAADASALTSSRAVELDFDHKAARSILAREAAGSCAGGLSCWIDLDATDRHAVERTLRSLGVNAHAIEEVLDRPDADGRHDIYEDCLHVAVSAVTVRDRLVATAPVNVLIAERFIVTIHSGPVDLLDDIARTFQRDFERYAQSLGFMLFEIFDHLIDGYRRGLRALSRDVEELQGGIFRDANDRIFPIVAEATRGMLRFRRNMLAARGVVHELATRRSPFVSETTRPFLENMVDTLERLSADLSVERDILSEALDLYLGITAHRTNRVVNRLTALSAIFLPLTFLCGVYGMNFKHMPEISWQFGYPAFWLVALTIVTTLIVLMKRARWI